MGSYNTDRSSRKPLWLLHFPFWEIYRFVNSNICLGGPFSGLVQPCANSTENRSSPYWPTTFDDYTSKCSPPGTSAAKRPTTSTLRVHALILSSPSKALDGFLDVQVFVAVTAVAYDVVNTISTWAYVRTGSKVTACCDSQRNQALFHAIVECRSRRYLGAELLYT